MKELFAFITVTILSISAVSAQNVSEHEQNRQRLEKEIRQLDSQLKKIAAQSSNALYRLDLVNAKVAARKKLVSESERKIKSYDREIRSKQKDIDILSSRVDTLEFYFSKLVRSAYKNRDAKIWYMYIIASDNLSQAYRRYGYFKNMAGQMREESEKIRASKKQLEDEKQKLGELRKSADKVRGERLEELKSLGREQQEADAVVRQLQHNKSQYQKQLNRKRREVSELNAKIERMVREAMKSEKSQDSKSSAKTSSSKPKTPIDYKLSGAFSGNKGKLPWPVEGPVVGGFGQQYHPVYKNLKLPFNNGINIAAEDGTEVIAVYDGVVKQIVVMPGYNQCVLIQHGTYFSFYCKLKNTRVKAGDKVRIGQVIGSVDAINGESQLHFQIWKGTAPQNPQLWLK